MHNVCLIGSFGRRKIQVISCISQNDFLRPQYVNILSILYIFSQIIGKKVAGGELKDREDAGLEASVTISG